MLLKDRTRTCTTVKHTMCRAQHRGGFLTLIWRIWLMVDVDASAVSVCSREPPRSTAAKRRAHDCDAGERRPMVPDQLFSESCTHGSTYTHIQTHGHTTASRRFQM